MESLHAFSHKDDAHCQEKTEHHIHEQEHHCQLCDASFSTLEKTIFYQPVFFHRFIQFSPVFSQHFSFLLIHSALLALRGPPVS